MFLIFVIYVLCLPLTIQGYWDYQGYSDDDLTTITQFVTKYGYPVETHIIVTEDGYILTTYRIPHGKESDKPNDKVILLVHGLGGTAENFLALGANNALAFVLADRGFDVWLFNGRGNSHSRMHIFLSPDFPFGAQFWDFSFHEIGIYDLPANIDYILEKTKKSKLFYIGHSQGTTSYFALMSERPEYNNKIEFGVMLAPPILMNFTENILKKLSKLNPQLGRFFNKLNIHELPTPYLPLLDKIFQSLCQMSEDAVEICIGLLYLGVGLESGLLDKSLVPLLLAHFPARFSTRQALHYAQEIRSGLFRKYDYEEYGNLIRYNQKEPPLYHLNNSKAPVALCFADGDFLAPIAQKAYLQKMIPNIFTIYEVPYKKFNHLDFLFAYNAKKLIYDPLYEIIMNFVQTNN